MNMHTPCINFKNYGKLSTLFLQEQFMAKPSQDLFRHADEVYQYLGFGNQYMLGIFAVLGIFSIFIFAGMMLPGLAASMSLLLSLLLGGVTFLAIALLSNLAVGGVIAGAILGLIVASISTTICSIISFLTPPLFLIVLTPNIYAGIVYGMGLVFSFFEACLSCLGISRFSLNNEVGAQYDAVNTHENPGRSSYPTVVSAKQERAFFDRRHPQAGYCEGQVNENIEPLELGR